MFRRLFTSDGRISSFLFGFLCIAFTHIALIAIYKQNNYSERQCEAQTHARGTTLISHTCAHLMIILPLITGKYRPYVLYTKSNKFMICELER